MPREFVEVVLAVSIFHIRDIIGKGIVNYLSSSISSWLVSKVVDSISIKNNIYIGFFHSEDYYFIPRTVISSNGHLFQVKHDVWWSRGCLRKNTTFMVN